MLQYVTGPGFKCNEIPTFMTKRLILTVSLARSGPSNFFCFPFDGAQGTTNTSESLYGCTGLCMVAERRPREC